MSETNAVATMLGRDTIGVLVVRKVGVGGWRVAAEATWQASPLEDAPTIDPRHLAQVLRASADRLDAIADR